MRIRAKRKKRFGIYLFTRTKGWSEGGMGWRRRRRPRPNGLHGRIFSKESAGGEARARGGKKGKLFNSTGIDFEKLPAMALPVSPSVK